MEEVRFLYKKVWMPLCIIAISAWTVKAVPVDSENTIKPAEERSKDGLEEEFELLREEDIVYTASKHEQDIFDSPSTVTVITRSQIEGSPCTTIHCLLSQVPELEVLYVKPMWQSVGARAMAGISSDKGLVLVDGQDITFDEFGMSFWGMLPVHIDDVERIEVIRGPGSALYGANAHSMVVSIITRKPRIDQAQLYLGSGEHGTSSLNARFEKIFEPWRVQLTAGMEENDHWQIQGTQERQVVRSSLKLLREGESSTSSFQLRYLEGNGTIVSQMAPMDVHRFVQGSAILLHENSWLRARLWCDYHQTDLTLILPLFYNGVKLGSLPDQILMKGFTMDGDVQTTWSPFSNNAVLAGINYRWLAFSIDVNNPSDLYQHRVGVFLQDEQRLWEQLLISGAIRLDYNSITPFAVSPRLAIGWSFSSRQLLRFAFGRAFSKPSLIQTSIHLLGVKGTAAFPELPAFFERSFGNENLGNYSLTAFEIGYRGQFLDRQLTLEADVFYNMYRNNIILSNAIKTNNLGLPDLANSELRFENSVGTDSVGGSASVTYQLQEALWLGANYTYRYSFNLKPATDPLTIANMGDRRDVFWEPKHLFNAFCQVSWSNGLRMGLALHTKSSRENAIPFDLSVFGKMIWVHMPSIVYLNGNVSWRVLFGQQWLEVGVNAFNLFNQGFRDMYQYTRYNGESDGGELVGRTLMLVLRGEL